MGYDPNLSKAGLLKSDDTKSTIWRIKKMMLEGIPGGNKQHTEAEGMEQYVEK